MHTIWHSLSIDLATSLEVPLRVLLFLSLAVFDMIDIIIGSRVDILMRIYIGMYPPCLILLLSQFDYNPNITQNLTSITYTYK
jgi:hypothetical protein